MAATRTSQLLAPVSILQLFLTVPALHPLAKYTPEGLLPLAVALYAALSIGGCVLLLAALRGGPRAGRLLARAWLAGILLVLLAAAAIVIYPHADALSERMRGSDQDDCIRLVTGQLLSGQPPYAVRTYLDNPCSTGPSLVLLYAPLAALGLLHLGAPLALLLAGGLRRAPEAVDWRQSNVFLLLILGSLSTWQLTVVGSDLVVIGCLMVVAAVGFGRYLGTARPAWGILGVLALAALAASRVNFLYLPVAFGAVFAFVRPRASALLSGVALLLSAGLVLLFWVAAPDSFSPLHLVAKGEAVLGPAGTWVAGAVCLLAGIAGLWLLKSRRGSADTVLLLYFATPLVILSLADLARVGFQLAWWGGASYLYTAAPMAVHAVLGRLAGPAAKPS